MVGIRAEAGECISDMVPAEARERLIQSRVERELRRRFLVDDGSLRVSARAGAHLQDLPVQKSPSQFT